MKNLVGLLLFAVAVGSVSANSADDASVKSLFEAGRFEDVLGATSSITGDRKAASYSLILFRCKAFEALSRPLDALRDSNLAPASSDSEGKNAFLLYKAQLSILFGRYDAAERGARLLPKSDSAQLVTKVRELERQYRELLGVDASNVSKTLELCAAILEHSKYFVEVIQRKVDALLRKGEFTAALHHLQDLLVYKADNTDTDFLIGKIFLASGDHVKALKFISSCVALDDERRDCVELRKHIKEYKKHIEEADSKLLRPSIASFEQLASDIQTSYPSSRYFDPVFPKLFQSILTDINEKLCYKYSKIKDVEKAKASCFDVIAADGKRSESGYENLATAYLETEQFESALSTVTEGLQRHPSSKTLRDLQKRATAEHKKAQKLDYYRILGVAKDASEKQITKAYRKLAQKWHPDKHPSDREAAEKKMRDINAALSVLTNPKKRALFDQGIDPEDPNDSTQGFHQQGSPYGNFADFDAIFQHFHQQQHRKPSGGGRRSDHSDRYRKYDL